MNRGNWGTVCCTVFGILVLFTTSCAADKVGYINLQRLVNESEMGKAASAEIQKMRAAKQAEVTESLAEVNRLKEQVNVPDTGDDPTGRRDQVEALQKAYKTYQRLVADVKEDLTREDKELVAIILRKADSVLKAVAKKNKFTIILKDPNAIGYLDPKVDITDLVLDALNDSSASP